MKKSIIAIAVSTAALASVPTFAAEGSTADIYGNIQYAYTDNDAGNNFEDNGSTIGLKGETTVSDSVTAFFKYEVEIEADQKSNGPDSGKVNLDQAYVGLKGDFGKVQVGSFDTIYNNAIQDNVDSFENLGFQGAEKTSEGDTIAYFSPSMNGFEVQVAAQVKGDSTDKETGDDRDGTAAMAVVKYTTGIVSVALGHDTRNNTASDAKSATGLAVTVTPLQELAVTAKYEKQEDTKDVFGLNARYAYGAGDVYASAQVISPDSGDDYNEFGAGVTYSLASNVYVFGEVASIEANSTADADTQTAVGVYYGF